MSTLSTSAVHLRGNVAGAGLSLSGEELTELDKIGHWLYRATGRSRD